MDEGLDFVPGAMCNPDFCVVGFQLLVLPQWSASSLN